VPAFAETLSLLLPILAPGILLIIALKSGWLPALVVPIDRGRTLGGAPLLGSTKTWLGFTIYLGGAVLVSAVIAAAGVGSPVFSDWPGWFVGLLVGLGYNAGELANSFVKRRLGVGSSSLTPSRWRGLQHVVDLGDGILVVFLVYLALGVPLVVAAVAGIAGFGVHVLTDVLMRALRLKRRRHAG
jgi:CDP-diglyceride synthetase